jgi:uncharacterized repeat protein (TIGR03803 family)
MRKALRLSAAIAAVCILTALTQAQIQPTKALSYKEKVLHTFTGQSDGGEPGPLMRDPKGNLYGTTANGGNMDGQCGQQNGFQGCGIVFELSAKGKFSVLHTFDFTDGAVPLTNLLQDASGNLYGTTLWGGNSACENGCGVVFRLTPAGNFSVLYSFTGASDGGYPSSGLIMDANGNLYGTTEEGTSNFGEVFELTTSGQLEVLYGFKGTTDGAYPNGLIRDGKGNLYGTTFAGGGRSCSMGDGFCGLVYKLDTSGKETVLYSFKGKADGAEPGSSLIMDEAGNLYGTTQLYGYRKGECHLPDDSVGCGTAFKIDTTGTFSVLVKFDNVDGNDPYSSPLTQDIHGNFSGTTIFGGNHCGVGGCGVVYKLNVAGKESVLYNFKGQSDGGDPSAGVVEDRKGNLYGTTSGGGDASCVCGVIFELTP